MQNLKFVYQNWSRAYYQLQSEEVTCWYYNNLYKSKRHHMSPKFRAEKTKNVETWVKYAHAQNKEFMKKMWEGEFSLKNSIVFAEKVDEIARLCNVTALLENTGQPYAYAEMTGMFLIVSFLDELGRVYMQYYFQNDIRFEKDEITQKRFRNGDLFLVEIQQFIFPEDKIDGDWKNKDFISYAFKPNGYMLVTKIFDVYGEHIIEEYEADKPVNVENNWEPYPKFGHWNSIFKMKRWEIGGLTESFNLK